MKKTIISIATAAVCASALSVTAFAEDILNDRSVYAADRERIAQAAGSIEWKGETITVDPNTVMPYYYVDLLDYARTGNFDIIPFAQKEGRDDLGEEFIADAVNENGDFAGTITLRIGGAYSGIGSYQPRTDKADSIAFETNARRISALMIKKKISSDCKEIKYVFVEGVGNVYYIDNGTSKFLAAAGPNEVSGEVFNSTNDGIVEINKNFKAYADRKLAEYEKYKREVLDKLAPGENPPEGFDPGPTFKVDNTPYLDSAENNVPSSDNEKNPDTGHGAGAALGAAALLSLTAGAVVVSKRRKDN